MNLRDVIQPAPKQTIRRDIGGLAIMMAVMGLCLGAIGVAASCSGAQKTTEKALAACVLTNIEPAVNAALSSDPADAVTWLAVLSGIAVECGPDLVTLAVQAFEKAPATPITSATIAAAHDRAEQWLKAHGGTP